VTGALEVRPPARLRPGRAAVRPTRPVRTMGPMATPNFAEPDYQALVDALAREGLGTRTEATRTVEAVMCALAQRIAAPEYDDLREMLPDPFRGRLFACERHAALPPRALRTAEEFYGIVGEDLEREPAEVEPQVRAVFAAIRRVMPEQAAEDVARHLPGELLALWRRPS
jgi:uncharacterized protein (DUF2267 family)